MEQRHQAVSGCLGMSVKDPELLAKSERCRKQSWSVVVGGTDYRSMDTGLNELDRVIGIYMTCGVCVCVCVRVSERERVCVCSLGTQAFHEHACIVA